MVRIQPKGPTPVPERRPTPKTKPRAKPAPPKDTVSTAKAKSDSTQATYWKATAEAQASHRPTVTPQQIQLIKDKIIKIQKEIKNDQRDLAAYKLQVKDYKKSIVSTHDHSLFFAWHETRLLSHDSDSAGAWVSNIFIFPLVALASPIFRAVDIFGHHSTAHYEANPAHNKTNPAHNDTLPGTRFGTKRDNAWAVKHLKTTILDLQTKLAELQLELANYHKAQAKKKEEAAVEAKMHTQISQHQGI